MKMADKVLIWCITRKMYWKAGGWGYTKHLCEAGLYYRFEANGICNLGQNIIKHEERIIELDDAFTSLQIEIRVERGLNNKKHYTHCRDCGDKLVKGKDSTQRGECLSCFSERKDLPK